MGGRWHGWHAIRGGCIIHVCEQGMEYGGITHNVCEMDLRSGIQRRIMRDRKHIYRYIKCERWNGGYDNICDGNIWFCDAGTNK